MSYINAGTALVKVGGAFFQGRANKMMANTQAMELDYQGQQEEQAAMQQADIIRRAGQYAVARADTGYAGAGVVVGEGSAAETDRRINVDSSHDALMTILTGQKRANQLHAQGAIGASAASSAASQGLFAAAGSAMQSMSGSGWATAPGVTRGSNPNGYNGTMNNPSAFVGG